MSLLLLLGQIPSSAAAFGCWSPGATSSGSWTDFLSVVIKYDALNYEPDSSSLAYPWTKNTSYDGSGTREADSNAENGYRMTLSAPWTVGDPSTIIQYAHGASAATSPWYLSVGSSMGYVIESRVQINSGTGASIIFQDGTKSCALAIKSSGIEVNAFYIAETTQTYTMDTTATYHVYNIAVAGTALSVSVDGTSRISASIDKSSSTRQLSFKDDGGVAYLDYIKYTLGNWSLASAGSATWTVQTPSPAVCPVV